MTFSTPISIFEPYWNFKLFLDLYYDFYSKTFVGNGCVIRKYKELWKTCFTLEDTPFFLVLLFLMLKKLDDPKRAWIFRLCVIYKLPKEKGEYLRSFKSKKGFHSTGEFLECFLFQSFLQPRKSEFWCISFVVVLFYYHKKCQKPAESSEKFSNSSFWTLCCFFKALHFSSIAIC